MTDQLQTTQNGLARMTVAQQTAIVATTAAAEHSFASYQSTKATNTVRAQVADLERFSGWLCGIASAAGLDGDCPTGAELASMPAAWRGVNAGHVAAFRAHLLAAGLAIGTVNRALSTVRTYARLAAAAGVIDQGDAAAIGHTGGYGHTEGLRIDARRDQVRKSTKKASSLPVSADQVRQLKAQPDTAQGRRDAVMMCLLLDHGLRAGELAIVERGHIDLAAGLLRFYRPKVDKQQTHELTADTLRALRAYIDAGDCPASGPILRTSRKGGALLDSTMSAVKLSQRVRQLGGRVGLVNLSAHDCRHSWATRAVAGGTSVFSLQDAGGWSSPAMPARYVQAATVANSGVRLA